MKTHILVMTLLFFLNSLKAQEKIKDTIFFNYDNKYLNTHVEIPQHFYLDDSSGGSNGSFFFAEVRVINNLNPKEILSLKKFIRSSNFYDKNKKQKLNDYKLWEYFNEYVVLFVKNNHRKTEYIHVGSGFEIE